VVSLVTLEVERLGLVTGRYGVLADDPDQLLARVVVRQRYRAGRGVGRHRLSTGVLDLIDKVRVGLRREQTTLDGIEEDVVRQDESTAQQYLRLECRTRAHSGRRADGGLRRPLYVNTYVVERQGDQGQSLLVVTVEPELQRYEHTLSGGLHGPRVKLGFGLGLTDRGTQLLSGGSHQLLATGHVNAGLLVETVTSNLYVNGVNQGVTYLVNVTGEVRRDARIGQGGYINNKLACTYQITGTENGGRRARVEGGGGLELNLKGLNGKVSVTLPLTLKVSEFGLDCQMNIVGTLGCVLN
jgi:hypothetical protein